MRLGDGVARMDAGDSSASFYRAVAAARASFVVALESGDARGASDVYAEDARLLPPGADVVQGRAAIEAFWRAGIDSGITAVELETVELVGHSRVVHEIGRYTMRLELSDGEAVLDRGTYLLLHAQKSDGWWLRAVEMFAPEPPRISLRRP